MPRPLPPTAVLPGFLVASFLGAELACTEEPRTYSTPGAQATPLFRDDFERDQLGPEWLATGEGAALVDGALVVEGLRNHPLWLRRPLPDDLRVEFDATPLSDEADIKVELAGDGRSSATTVNYIASGYVAIFGGWNGSLHALVRQNEHGRDRKTTTKPEVEVGRRYRFVLIRQQGVIRWEVDGRELLRYEDEAPLVGPEHAHFAFSGWDSRVRFDNLVIYSL